MVTPCHLEVPAGMSSSVVLVAMGCPPQNPMEVGAAAFQGLFGEEAAQGWFLQPLVPGDALESWLMPS